MSGPGDFSLVCLAVKFLSNALVVLADLLLGQAVERHTQRKRVCYLGDTINPRTDFIARPDQREVLDHCVCTGFRVDAVRPELPSIVAVLENTPPPLPPPDGVIVLYPGGEREELAECPEGFTEVTKNHGWRFCIDHMRPEPIPALWTPPTAGIPCEECQEIFKRNKDTLGQLPGVTSVGLDRGGIHVYTDEPTLVPEEVEGLPIHILPPLIMKDY